MCVRCIPTYFYLDSLLMRDCGLCGHGCDRDGGHFCSCIRHTRLATSKTNGASSEEKENEGDERHPKC